MVTVYIKKQQFFKNVDELGNIFEIEYPTRDVVSENGIITETYDNYIENGFKKVELDEQYKDCNYFDFNEDLTFNVEKYNARKQEEKKRNYKREVERLIALRYDIYDELAIRRQKDEKPEKYKEYYAYVEQCKVKAKEEYVVCN